MKNLIALCLSVLLLTGCFPDSESIKDADEVKRTIKSAEVEPYWIKFYTITDPMEVYLNDSLVHEITVAQSRSPIEEHVVGLTSGIKPGKNKLEIKVYNGMDETFIGFDKNWEVLYEIFRNEVPVDYIHEQGANGKKGLVWTNEHEIIPE